MISVINNLLLPASRLSDFVQEIPESLGDLAGSTQSAWRTTKSFFKSIEPYQPLAATLTIISKALWKKRSEPSIKKNIRRMRFNLKILKQVQATTKVKCERRIDILSEDLRATEHSVAHTWFAYLQLFSLLFPHPGSNIWNSVNNLSGKCYSIYHHIPPLIYSGIEASTENAVHAALSMVSALGTTTSLLKQTGTIEGNDPLSHTIIAASFIAMGIETGIMVKKWIQKKFSNIAS